MQDLITYTEKNYTYEDYLRLDDGNDYEVIGGKLILVPKPRLYHQEIVGRLIIFLGNFIKENRQGKIYSDVDVIFADQVVSPDVIFISKDRFSIMTENNIQGAPDLVIEVLSPSTQKYDRKQKSQLYYSGGVKEYWIVDPGLQLVEIFVPGEKDWNRAGVYDEEDILYSPLLHGLKIVLKELFVSE
jgi:Uma2 family endonuclease